MSDRKISALVSLERCLESIEHICKLLRKMLAELRIMVGPDVLNLPQPAFDINLEQLCHISIADTFRSVDCINRRHDSNRCINCLCRSIAALEDPLEDAAIIAITRPDEVAIGILAEPVDIEDLRKDILHPEKELPCRHQSSAGSNLPCCNRRMEALRMDHV